MQQSNPTHFNTSSLRTLLVEPDELPRRNIELALSIRSQAIESFEDAASALAAFHDNVFQIVIIRSELPGGDALQLCRDIRALPGSETTTIVVMCGASSEQDRVPVLEAGADDVVSWLPTDESFGVVFDQIERMALNRLAATQSIGPGTSERFLVINPNGTIRVGAPVSEKLLGFPPEAIVGINAFSFFHPDDTPQLLSIITEAFSVPRQTRAIEVRVRRDGDAWQTIALSATNRLSDPQLRGIVFDLRGPDVSVGIDDQVTRATMHDRVTDLPNRSLFLDRVDHALKRAERRQQAIVVMVIDLNAFASPDGQPRTDTDDNLIVAVSQRLRSCLRSSDTASRLDHDHFGVLLEEVQDVASIEVVADRLIRALSAPFFSSDADVTLCPHIGIAMNSASRTRAGEILRDANIARAWSRVQGSGSYVTFDASMQPPDDEPMTSEFPNVDVIVDATSHDNRLDELSERIASLEQLISRIASTREV